MTQVAVDAVFQLVWDGIFDDASKVKSTVLMDSLRQVLSSDAFINEWIQSSKDENQDANQSDIAELLKRQTNGLFRCFQNYINVAKGEEEIFREHAGVLLLTEVDNLAREFKDTLIQFEENQFGVAQIPRIIELKQAVQRQFQLPNAAHGVLVHIVNVLLRCNGCTAEQTRVLKLIIMISQYVDDITKQHVEIILEAAEPVQLKTLLMISSGGPAEVHRAYAVILSLLSNCQCFIEAGKLDAAINKLRDAFTMWEMNRQEAEKRRRDEDELAKRKKDMATKAAGEQQKKNKTAIDFIIKIKEKFERDKSMAKDPLNPKEPHPFYILGFHPKKTNQDLKTVVKECRKLLPKLTHPDKLRSNVEDEKQRANEAFRVAGIAVKAALKMVDTPHFEGYHAMDLPNLECAPWIDTLKIEPHDGIYGMNRRRVPTPPQPKPKAGGQRKRAR